MPTKRKSSLKAVPATPTPKKVKTEAPLDSEPRKLRSVRAATEEEIIDPENVEEEVEDRIDDGECEESDVQYMSKNSGGSRSARGTTTDKKEKSHLLKPHQRGAGDDGGKKVLLDESEGESSEFKFIGDPIPDEEARQRWPQRYQVAVSTLFCFC